MMRLPSEKIVSLADLAKKVEAFRREGKRVVTTNGCFDILHWGHIQYLSEARKLGDLLICGVNADVSVRGLKGPNRPLFPEKVRASQVAGLESIDWVTIFPEATPENFLRTIKPDLHVKGADYDGKDIPERKVIEASGGKVVFLPLAQGFSTTKILELLSDK